MNTPRGPAAPKRTSRGTSTTWRARGDAQVQVVGLGGSAGSIEALQDFFCTMPPDTGLAFIVVMHLARDHEIFRSLADSHGSHAAAVILSGMDGDGAVGIRRVKERGGLAIAHDPHARR